MLNVEYIEKIDQSFSLFHHDGNQCVHDHHMSSFDVCFYFYIGQFAWCSTCDHIFLSESFK